MSEHTHECEGCFVKATFSTDAEGRHKTYHDCEHCGKRNGMRFISQYDKNMFLRFSHNGGYTNYEKIRNRPRGI